MPPRAAAVTYAEFIANCDAAAVIETLEGAPNRDAIVAAYADLTTAKAPPTAFYNLVKSLVAIRDGKSYLAGSKEYGNPTGESDFSKISVPMQGGLTFAGINTLAAAFADRGAALYPSKANGNGNGNGEHRAPAAPPASAATSPTGGTPVTSGSGPASVDPILIDTVKSLQERFSSDDAAALAPLNGRAFLQMLWDETPEEERNRRVNSIARAFVEARESGSRRGELRVMVDNLSRALKDDDKVAPDFDIWTYIYNRALPTEAQSESYEQIKSNLKNAYRFDPDAAAFRDWESALTAYATMTMEMFSKDIAESLGGMTGIVSRAALKRTRETLDSIASGMAVAQSRFNEWETRNLRSIAPAPPVLDSIPYANLSPAVQGMVEEEMWGMLSPEKQRQWMVNRNITPIEGAYVTAEEAKAAADRTAEGTKGDGDK
jgi:hypothetical protein